MSMQNYILVIFIIMNDILFMLVMCFIIDYIFFYVGCIWHM